MLFSIITVCWNAAKVIAPTLQSVREQTCTDYEYLVIDGASRDNTVQLVREAQIAGTRIVSEPDKGLYDAMNKALAAAQGEYVIFLNAGDSFATSHSLAEIAAQAEGRPGVIYGQTQLVNEQREVVGKRHLTAPETLTADSFKNGMLVCHQAFVARRDLAPRYDLAYRFSADYDWCVKILRKSERNAYVGDAPIINFLTDGLTNKHHKKSLWERYRIMCHHFGVVTATLRHLSFIPRFLNS